MMHYYSIITDHSDCDWYHAPTLPLIILNDSAMRCLLHYLFLTLSFCLSMHYVAAQLDISRMGEPMVTLYSTDDFPGGTQTWEIDQNQYGVLFFANNRGLLEFDGKKWESHPLPNRTIARSLLIHGRSGRYYVGGQGEVGFFEPNEIGQFVFHSLLDHNPSLRGKVEDVWRIYALHENIFFNSSKRLFKLNDSLLLDTIESPSAMEFAFLFKEDLYAYGHETGLMKLEKGKRLIVPLGGEQFKGTTIAAILPSSTGEMMVATHEKGVFVFSEGEVEPWNSTLQPYFLSNQIYRVIQLKNGWYAFGTKQDGVLITDQNGKIKTLINQDHGLENDNVRSLFQDEEKNLWVGLDNGIAHIDLQSPFSFINIEPHMRTGAYGSVLHDSVLYLGTATGLYAKDVHQSKKVESKFVLVENSKGEVWGVNSIKGSLFLGHHTGFSQIIGQEALKISDYYGGWKSIEIPGVRNLMIGGHYEGLLLYQQLENGLWRVKSPIKGFSESSRVKEMESPNQIWVSHIYKGVYKLTLSKNYEQVEQQRHYDQKAGFPSNWQINVFKIRDQIIFGTEKGVYVYDHEKDRFKESDFWNRLIGKNRFVRFLTEDKPHKNIWGVVDNEMVHIRVNKNGELERVDNYWLRWMSGKFIENFEHINPLNPNEFIAGTPNGFLHCSNIDQPNPEWPFNAQIREFYLMNRQDSLILAGSLGLERDSANGHEPQLHFARNESNIRIRYAANTYTDLKHLEFSYKVFKDGELIRPWSSWSTRNEKEFSNLEPGHYTFTIMARKSNEIQSKPASIQFTVQKSLIQKLSVGGIVLLLIIIGILGYYFRRRYLNATNQLQKDQDQVNEIKFDLIWQKVREKYPEKESELSKNTMKKYCKLIWEGKDDTTITRLMGVTQGALDNNKAKYRKLFGLDIKRGETLKSFFDEIRQEYWP